MKQKLIEQVLVKINSEQLEVLEKNTLIESKGKEYSARGILKDVPVTKFTENLNKRIYSKKLWENVKKLGVFECSLSLADHSENEGSVKDIVGVWKNFKINEDNATADLYCVGKWGSLLLEMVAASGRAGFSTVGFGEFLSEKENEVNPDSYEYERTDWVLNPSQQVFATFENFESVQKNIEKVNNIEENIQISDKEITNKKEEIIESVNQKSKEVNYMEKFERYNMKNQINEIVRQAKKNDDLKEAISILNELEIDPEMMDLRSKVDNTISELQEKLEIQKNEAQKKAKELEEDLKEITSKYEKAKSIIEKIGLDENVNVDELKETVQNLQEKVKNLEENNIEMKKDLDIIEEVMLDENVKSLEITSPQEFKELAEDTIKRDEDIEFLKNKNKEFEKFLTEAEEAIKEREEKLQELGFTFGEKEEKKEDDDEEMKDKDKKDDEDEKEEKKEEEDKDEKDDDKEDDEDEKEEKKEKKKEEVEWEFKFNHEEKTKLEEEKKEEIKEEIKENKEVQLFVEREIKKNPAYKDFKEELLKSTSLEDAIEKLENFENKKEEIVEKKEEIEENFTNIPSWLGVNRI